MNREIQELLQELQKFTNLAIEKLQKGDKISSAFFFNLSSSISNELADKVKQSK